MIKSKAEKEDFVKKNLGLVHSCAARMRGRGIEYEDLYGAGCVGLLKAIEGFDETRGLMFSTYAVPVILGEMRRLFRDGGAIKVSRGIKETSIKVTRERERLAKRLGRDPTVTELAEAVGIDTEQVVEAINVSHPPLSLTASEDEGGGQIDVAAPSYEEKICDEISLNSIISSLEENDQRLIKLRYYENKTQSQTAQALNMTQVQVSRREKKLIEKMRLLFK